MVKNKEPTQKNCIFPRELIRQCLKENNLKDGTSEFLINILFL